MKAFVVNLSLAAALFISLTTGLYLAIADSLVCRSHETDITVSRVTEDLYHVLETDKMIRTATCLTRGDKLAASLRWFGPKQAGNYLYFRQSSGKNTNYCQALNVWRIQEVNSL